MHRTLIVARLEPDHCHDVARVFAGSDRTELPHLVGVVSRTLFSYQGLYFHLIESERDPAPALRGVRDHPLFIEVDTKLSRHVTAYRPDWKEPADAMAAEFYHWSRTDRSPTGGLGGECAAPAPGGMVR
jgi:cyclase